eukprot:2883529-Pyramimonas_sp.AAC.1
MCEGGASAVEDLQEESAVGPGQEHHGQPAGPAHLQHQDHDHRHQDAVQGHLQEGSAGVGCGPSGAWRGVQQLPYDEAQVRAVERQVPAGRRAELPQDEIVGSQKHATLHDI